MFYQKVDHADAEHPEDEEVAAVEDVKMPISNIQFRLIRRVNDSEINQESISIKNIPQQDYHSHFNMKFKIVKRKEKSKQNSRPRIERIQNQFQHRKIKLKNTKHGKHS